MSDYDAEVSAIKGHVMPKFKGYTFGMSREAVSDKFLRQNPQFARMTPGPGAYNPKLTLRSESSKSFTMIPRR